MEDWKSYLSNTEVIIHAGGRSEGWYPVTQGEIPKVMTEIGSKQRPMIDWTILPYVKAGVKKFFITLWHDPEKIISHCNDISRNTGIEFVFLKEEGMRMGRAGVLKHYLEKGILDPNKNKINVGGADIVNLDLEDFLEYHLEGLNQGYLVTLIGSTSGHAQFDKIIFDPIQGSVFRIDGERQINLMQGEYANTGTACFDARMNQMLMQIPESRFPVDWENLGADFFTKGRAFGKVKLFESWIPLKTPHDYKKSKGLDFEKWFNVNSVEDHLGAYTPGSNLQP